MTCIPSTRVTHAPTWVDSILFLSLMSGPPKFRGRDAFASLAGEIDLVVAVHVVVWACGGLWVLARLYPAVLRWWIVPSVNGAQVIGALFIVALSLSMWESPAVLLTAFSLGQLAVMLAFTWVFTQRYGASACLRHLFAGVTLLALAIVAALYFAPGLVTDDAGVVIFQTRIRGDYITDTGSVTVMGLVLCLSNMPSLRGRRFWGALTLFGVLLLASRTRSAYVAFLAFLVIGFVYGKGLPVRKLILPLMVAGFSVFAMDALSATIEYLVRERESIESMSDRIPLWEYLTRAVVRESPITGLGYYSASRILSTEYNPALGNAHSAFFEVLVGGGLLAAALYIVLCASLLICAIRLLRLAAGQPGAVASAGLLVAALLMGLTSPASLHAGPLGFAFWASTALLPALARDAAPLRSPPRAELLRARTSSRRSATVGRLAPVRSRTN
jgi:O-antigen ligase